MPSLIGIKKTFQLDDSTVGGLAQSFVTESLQREHRTKVPGVSAAFTVEDPAPPPMSAAIRKATAREWRSRRPLAPSWN